MKCKQVRGEERERERAEALLLLSVLTADVCDVAADRGVWPCRLDETRSLSLEQKKPNLLLHSTAKRDFLLMNKPGHL